MEPRWHQDLLTSNRLGNDDIWVYDFETNEITQVTRNAASDQAPDILY